jgi:hypothetical protein
MSQFDAVNKTYGLKIVRGMSVTWTATNGVTRTGVVTRSDGKHVMARLEGESVARRFHPQTLVYTEGTKLLTAAESRAECRRLQRLAYADRVITDNLADKVRDVLEALRKELFPAPIREACNDMQEALNVYDLFPRTEETLAKLQPVAKLGKAS